ncbi:MAG: SLC5 family protein [Armatimonadota bacterium]
MRLAELDVTVFVVYIVLVIIIGAAASRRVSATKRDYFLAGDKLPWWMVGGSIVAANISSHHFVGVMGTAYARGFVAMTIEWGAILLGFNALLWIFLPFYLRNGFYTMPEFLEKRFGSAARTTFAGLILITYVFVEIAAVLYLGAVALHSLLGIQMFPAIIGLAVFTGVYTIAGGLRAVVWTEMLQLAVLLAGGIALSIATIHKVGGVSAIMATSAQWDLILPPTDSDFPWTMYLGGITCISVFYCAANQFIVQRTLAAKDEWHARMGVVFTDYLKFLMPLIIIVPGMLAPQLFPRLDKPDMAFPVLVKNL